MPWYIIEELNFFRDTTLGHALVMGRSTFEGINKVLPGRTTYILTRKKDYHYDHPNVIVVNDMEKLIDEYKNSDKTLFIAGGATIYATYFHYADEMIISNLFEEYEGDASLNIDYTNYDITKEVDYPNFRVKYYKKILE